MKAVNILYRGDMKDDRWPRTVGCISDFAGWRLAEDLSQWGGALSDYWELQPLELTLFDVRETELVTEYTSRWRLNVSTGSIFFEGKVLRAQIGSRNSDVWLSYSRLHVRMPQQRKIAKIQPRKRPASHPVDLGNTKPTRIDDQRFHSHAAVNPIVRFSDLKDIPGQPPPGSRIRRLPRSGAERPRRLSVKETMKRHEERLDEARKELDQKLKLELGLNDADLDRT